MTTLEFIQPHPSVIPEIRAMLRTGEIAPSDRWHAQQLADDPDHLQKSNVRWLESVISRGGAAYKASA